MGALLKIWRRSKAREGRISFGSFIDEQRRCGDKDPQLAGRASAGCWRPLALSHRPRKLSGMLLRCALPAARWSLAHAFPIREMGSGNHWISEPNTVKPTGRSAPPHKV